MCAKSTVVDNGVCVTRKVVLSFIDKGMRSINEKEILLQRRNAHVDIYLQP